jgi:hypothetical protein
VRDVPKIRHLMPSIDMPTDAGHRAFLRRSTSLTCFMVCVMGPIQLRRPALSTASNFRKQYLHITKQMVSSLRMTTL